MRAALEARILGQATARGTDAGRLRRRLVFQRVLRRLADDDRWVLKGGYLLEARVLARARATRDLDLVSAEAGDVEQLRCALEDALACDPDGDFFRFGIRQARPLGGGADDQSGWRFSLVVLLNDRVFDTVRIDIVERVEETVGGTETVELPSPVAGVAFTSAHVLAVDVAQHAAEKFHALCRTYASDRPSTRVKDLVDIVLLVDVGLLPDARLGDRLRAVFSSRDSTDPPSGLPDPPVAWRIDYTALVAELDVSAREVALAMRVANEVYEQALA